MYGARIGRRSSLGWSDFHRLHIEATDKETKLKGIERATNGLNIGTGSYLLTASPSCTMVPIFSTGAAGTFLSIK